MKHIYQTGQLVHFTPKFHGGSAVGNYEIMGPMPTENDGRKRYRIKNATERFERVAEENQLAESGPDSQ